MMVVCAVWIVFRKWIIFASVSFDLAAGGRGKDCLDAQFIGMAKQGASSLNGFRYGSNEFVALK
jgi:hypothetical protein